MRYKILLLVFYCVLSHTIGSSIMAHEIASLEDELVDDLRSIEELQSHESLHGNNIDDVNARTTHTKDVPQAHKAMHGVCAAEIVILDRVTSKRFIVVMNEQRPVLHYADLRLEMGKCSNTLREAQFRISRKKLDNTKTEYYEQIFHGWLITRQHMFAEIPHERYEIFLNKCSE